jgi:hypothetical protein
LAAATQKMAQLVLGGFPIRQPGCGCKVWVDVMAGSDLQSAFERLDRAITAVEAETGHRRALLEEREKLYAEVARLSTDRAHLAQLLDSARAETRAMEAANQAVSQRLLDVMENIRTVLAGDSTVGGPAGSQGAAG